jgi:hypothetical protein
LTQQGESCQAYGKEDSLVLPVADSRRASPLRSARSQAAQPYGTGCETPEHPFRVARVGEDRNGGIGTATPRQALPEKIATPRQVLPEQIVRSLFLIRSECIIDVLAELKAMEESTDALHHSSGRDTPVVRTKACEIYMEWANGLSFRDTCLCSPSAYLKMKAFISNGLSEWLENQCRMTRADPSRTKALQESVELEMRRVCYLAAKIRGHYSRLPRDLQESIQNGDVHTFEHIYDYIASAEFN